jgi:hypothetical protein
MVQYLRSNLVALVALFVALSAGAYAAGLPKDSIKSKQIKAGAVKNPDLADSAVTSPKVADGSLLGRDFAPGELARGEQGPQGATGPQGLPGADGQPGRSALSSLQSGERLVGTWATQGSEVQVRDAITLPIPAPTPIDSLHAVYQNSSTNGGTPPPASETPAEAGCTGTMADPVSAPGYVCIYANPAGVNAGFGYGINCTCSSFTATGDGSRFGFVVVTNSTGGAQGTNGVWVYTAP